MTDQTARLTSLCNAFTNAIRFGAPIENSATKEYDAIKTSLLRTVEGTRTWEKFCNRNGFYYTHTSADYFNGNSPVVGLGG